MGLFDALMGNASGIDPKQLNQELKGLLAPGEQVEVAFQLVRDQLVLTSKRVILIDRQGMSGRKVEFLSIPYRSIVRFSAETAGTLDMDGELKLWVTGETLPIAYKFGRASKEDLFSAYAVLGTYLLK